MTPPSSGPTTGRHGHHARRSVPVVPAALARADHRGDDDDDQRLQAAEAEPLDRAPGDEHLDRRREAGPDRADREDQGRHLDQQLLVDEVRHLPPERGGRRRGEQGGHDHPGVLPLGAVEVGDDRRQGVGDDRRGQERAEHRQQQAGQGQQHLAAGGGGGDGLGAHACSSCRSGRGRSRVGGGSPGGGRGVEQAAQQPGELVDVGASQPARSSLHLLDLGLAGPAEHGQAVGGGAEPPGTAVVGVRPRTTRPRSSARAAWRLVVPAPVPASAARSPTRQGPWPSSRPSRPITEPGTPASRTDGASARRRYPRTTCAEGVEHLLRLVPAHHPATPIS